MHKVNIEGSASGSTSGPIDDSNRIDINFENIHYTVSVPKQKGESLNTAKPLSAIFEVLTYKNLKMCQCL